jgi:hypothetical protein
MKTQRGALLNTQSMKSIFSKDPIRKGNIQKDFCWFSDFKKSRNFIKNSINFNANCQNNMWYKPFLFFGNLAEIRRSIKPDYHSIFPSQKIQLQAPIFFNGNGENRFGLPKKTDP